MVHFDHAGGSGKFYIHAQPQFKTIAVFDEHMQPVSRQSIPKGDAEPKAGHEAKEKIGSADIANSGGVKQPRAGRKRKLKNG
jgi:hypothetical protein